MEEKRSCIIMRMLMLMAIASVMMTSCDKKAEVANQHGVIGVYQGHDSLRFKIIAPGLTSMSVIGDHSLWEPLRMIKHADTFYLAVPRVEREFLRYQYVLPDGQRIGDPYSSIVLDPERDWITPAYARTNNLLPPYPKEFTTGDVSVKDLWVRPYRWTSDANFTIRNKRNMTIYDLDGSELSSIGNTVALGKRISSKIAELKSLNVNAVIITPQTSPQPDVISYPLMLDKAFGLPADMKAFVDSMHNAEIGVIVRLNVWRYYKKSPLACLWQRAAETATEQNKWLRTFAHTTENGDAEIRMATRQAHDLVDTTLAYWLKGFRADGVMLSCAPESKYDQDRIANVRHWAHTVWKSMPESVVLCDNRNADEMEANELAKEGILMLSDAKEGFVKACRRQNCISNISVLDYRRRGWWEPRAVGIIDTIVEDMDDKMAMAEAVIYLSIPGPKIIKQGQEGEPNSTKRSVFETVSRLRANEPIFGTANYETNTDSLFKRITLRNGDHVVICLANFDTVAKTYRLEHSPSGEWRDIISGRRFVTSSGGKDVLVESGESMMLETE